VTLFHVAAETPEGSGVGAEYHVPALGQEVLELLGPSDFGVYLDGTVGGGGHAHMLLDACSTCRVIASDRDPEALRYAQEALTEFADRVDFHRCRYDEVLDALDPTVELAGALLDLGVSSRQLDSTERGFTFRPGAELDMRMEGSSGEGPTARDLLNEEAAEDLVRLFREYGEEPRAKRLVREIVARRESGALETSDDLVAALSRAFGRAPSQSDKARIFQALRIAVNREIELLEQSLPRIRDRLGSDGVLAVISYHSGEDRVVKRAFREWSRSCVCPPGLPICACRGEPLGVTLTPGPVRPAVMEVERNPRSRSARLRAWRRA
jgi:16S rRNA (cytosine1402-N4)-methyltransferase